MTPLRKRMLEELQRRNYNPDTIRGYLHAVQEFAEYFSKSPELLGAEEVREFQLYMMREKKLALGTVVLRMGALRFRPGLTDIVFSRLILPGRFR